MDASRPVALALMGVLSGCATYAPTRVQPGQTVDDVRAAMGPETGRYALAGGASRLEYARGPFGKHTYMIDLDPQGRVTGWRQVLTDADFNAVLAGTSDEALLAAIGRPSQRRGGGRQGGEVWSWRYETTFCQWFQVSVIDHRVHDTAYGPDPLCDDDWTSGP